MLVDKYKGMTLKEMKQAKKDRSKALRDANKKPKKPKPQKTEAEIEAARENKKRNARIYYEANKERLLAQKNEYRQANKEKIAKKDKEYKDARRLNYNIIYCIPNYDGKGGNYAGVTNQPEFRMKSHKSSGKLNIQDWFILDIVIDRTEAEASESAFHSQGYHGDVRDTILRRAA